MKKTSADAIVEQLIREISTGKLRQGTKLEEQALADRLGVSRTPIREALRQLATLGLIKIRGRRGYAVTEVTIEELSQMFESMGELEALCARLAAQRMSLFERKALEDTHMKCYNAVQRNDTEEYMRSNEAFHLIIYKGTHNKYIEEIATTFRRRTAPFRDVQFLGTDRLHASHAAHAKIVDAINNVHPDKAFLDMQAHATQAGMAVLNRWIMQTVADSKS
jgi:DNA-binding GntR family transcriptional regulator